MPDQRSEISRNMVERYSKRYAEMGYDVKTLGWGSAEQQAYRFDQLVRHSEDFKDKQMLDIGCGFGDLARHFMDRGLAFRSYLGWDLNPDLISEARNRWETVGNVSFGQWDISMNKCEEPVAEVGVMIGVLNLNLGEQMDNYTYSFNAIDNALTAVSDLLVVDFLSNRLDPSYPEEDFVFYHDPQKMLGWALERYPDVRLLHDYAPIPQKEFMLFIHK